MLDILDLYGSLNVKLLNWLISLAKRKEDFSISELLLLWKIHRRGTAKISELSKEVGIPPSTMTGILDRLEAQGYVTRVHDAKDRRSVLVSETSKLSTLVEEWKNSVSTELQAFSSTLPDGFFDQFRRDLLILQQSLERNEGNRLGRTE